MEVLTILSFFNENVPVFECTVKQFIIGFIALFLVAWFLFWVWAKLKSA